MNVLEGFGLGKVIDDDGADGSSVVGIGDGPESLLTGRIPNLVLDCFVFKVNSFGGELYTNSRFGIHGERVLYESGQKVGFAHTRITNHDYLIEEIELLLP